MQQLAEFKEATRQTWRAGDYDAMMREEGLYEVGERIASRVGVEPGEAVLDVACGTGNAAIPAARVGARVTGVDLTPELLTVARQRSAAAGVDVEWVDGDVEDLPFDDASFDVVLSTFGCMFAPRHDVTADEMARVLRPGGRLGLCTWTPQGAIGDFFAAVGPYLPPPPEFAGSPLGWGEEQYIQELFEGTDVALELERETFEIAHGSPDAAVDCYTTKFGPVVEARELAEADGRWPELRNDLEQMFARYATGPDGRVVLPAEYLAVVGRKQP